MARMESLEPFKRGWGYQTNRWALADRHGAIATLSWERTVLNYYGLAGLSGSSSFTSTQTVTPTTAAPPVPTAIGEFRARPLAPGAAPAALLGFCRFLSDEVSEDSSRVVSCPWARVTVSLPSLMVTSPLRTAILTVDICDVELGPGVQAFDAGVTFTSPAVVAVPLEVATLTAP